jgi:ribosomal protein L29
VDPNKWDVVDAILRVGSGTSTHRSDALRVMKSGVTQIKDLRAATLTVGETDVMAMIEMMRVALVGLKVELAAIRATLRVDQVENTARLSGLRAEVVDAKATLQQENAELAMEVADVATDLSIYAEEYWSGFWSSLGVDADLSWPFAQHCRNFIQERVDAMELALTDVRDLFFDYLE